MSRACADLATVLDTIAATYAAVDFCVTLEVVAADFSAIVVASLECDVPVP